MQAMQLKVVFVNQSSSAHRGSGTGLGPLAVMIYDLWYEIYPLTTTTYYPPAGASACSPATGVRVPSDSSSLSCTIKTRPRQMTSCTERRSTTSTERRQSLYDNEVLNYHEGCVSDKRFVCSRFQNLNLKFEIQMTRITSDTKDQIMLLERGAGC
jgi:hypothetical protein